MYIYIYTLHVYIYQSIHQSIYRFIYLALVPGGLRANPRDNRSRVCG